jgi:hypothetical protein
VANLEGNEENGQNLSPERNRCSLYVLIGKWSTTKMGKKCETRY